MRCCLLGRLVRDSVPEAFTGDWSRRHLLPSAYKNSRFLEGERVFNVNSIVYTVSLLIRAWRETLWKSQVPRCQPRARQPFSAQSGDTVVFQEVLSGLQEWQGEA